MLIREIDEHALIALVLKFSQAPSRVLQREQEAFFAMGERRTWRKAEAVDDLTTHCKALRMAAGVPYETSNPGPGQNLLLAWRPFSQLPF